MAKAFEFKKENSANLDICGKKYVIEVTAEIIEASDEIRVNFATVSETAKTMNGAKSINHICEFCANSIDRLLGKGSTKDIFGDKAITLPNLIDLLIYIQEEISEVFTRAQLRYLNIPKNDTAAI